MNKSSPVPLATSQTAEVSGSRDLLPLDPVLDGLRVDQLLELLLLSDEKMVLMSGSLGRHSVVARGNILPLNDSHRQTGWRLGQLALLVELGLGWVGVQDGRDGFPVDDRGGEVSRGRGSTEGIVGTGGCREAGRQLGEARGEAEQSS